MGVIEDVFEPICERLVPVFLRGLNLPSC